ncbi:MAG: hypothetical protein R3D56_05010 [Paracoccaceae bacterium]
MTRIITASAIRTATACHRAPGQRYLIVRNRIMVVDEATYTVVTVLNAIDAI